MLGMTTPAAGNDRLAWFVEQRRVLLRLSQAKAAKLAGINRNVWMDIEKASGGKRDTTFAGVEEALGWEPGSCTAILGGGEPAIKDDAVRPGTQVERLRLILAAIEDPTVDWDVDSDVLDLMAKKVRAALQRATTEAKRAARNAG